MSARHMAVPVRRGPRPTVIIGVILAFAIVAGIVAAVVFKPELPIDLPSVELPFKSSEKGEERAADPVVQTVSGEGTLPELGPDEGDVTIVDDSTVMVTEDVAPTTAMPVEEVAVEDLQAPADAEEAPVGADDVPVSANNAPIETPPLE